MEKDSYTPEEIKKKFDDLPTDVKSLVYGADMQNLIKKISETHQLHIDKIEILEGLTADVMTGFLDAAKFVPALVESLRIDESKANAIAKEINDGLFTKIRESMKKMYEPGHANEKSVIMPSAASPATAPPPEKPAPVPVPPALVPPAPAAISKATSPAPTVAKPLEIHAADLMLSEPTVSMPPKPAPAAPPTPATTSPSATAPASSSPASATKVEAPKPAPYKADPYREPPE